MKNIFVRTINISLSLAIGTILFLLAKPVIVAALANEDSKIYESEVRVGDNGYSQIVVKDQNGEITFITDEPMPHADPQIYDQTLVWMAQLDTSWQIFMHDLTSSRTVQLTTSGNNVNPKVSSAGVVWEGYIDNTWQIFFFDGYKISQLTSGEEPKQDVDIENSLIAYAQEEGDLWQVYSINVTDDESSIISSGANGRNPHIKSGVISWQAFDELGEVTYEYNVLSKKLTKLENKPSNEEKQDEPGTEGEDIITIETDKEETQEELITIEDIEEELGIGGTEPPVVIVEEIKEEPPIIERPVEEIIIQDEDVPESTSTIN